jgi:hypothetical protein
MKAFYPLIFVLFNFILFNVILFNAGCEKVIPLPAKPAPPKNINIHVAFGYKDARPARFVGDRYERIYFIEQLLKPCADLKAQACDFSRSPDDGNLLIKNIPSLPPINISLRITGSSAGPDDDQNRRNPYQKILSQKSESNFLGGVNKGATTLYIGHSRDGGGPDFSPPILGKGKHVNYDFYRKKCPGLKQLQEALHRREAQTGKDKPVLALISCASADHFTNRNLSENLDLHAVKGLIYYSEALDQGLTEISNYIQKLLTATTAGAST